MRISLILELLLIFILLAFVASKSVSTKPRTPSLLHYRQSDLPSTPPIQEAPAEVAPSPLPTASPVTQPPAVVTVPPRYCSCSTILCNCCRDFAVPLLNLRGPGCASLQYLQDDRIAVALSFADRVVTNTTISSRRPRPVCMPLPGGVSRFCGRLYNIRRDSEGFKACLGLELRALSDLEASVRVSCFRFGPEGVRLESAQPLPVLENENEDEDDDDDDDDALDFDDDDDDDDDDEGISFDDDDDDDDDDVNDVDDSEFSVFRADFFDDLFDDDTDTNQRPAIKRLSTTTTTTTTTKKPFRIHVRRPSIRPSSVNKNKRVSTSTPTTTTTVKVTRRKPTRSTTPSRPAKLSTTPRSTTVKTRRTTTQKTTTTATPRTTVTRRNKYKKRTTTTSTTPSTTISDIPSSSSEPTTVDILPAIQAVMSQLEESPMKHNEVLSENISVQEISPSTPPSEELSTTEIKLPEIFNPVFNSNQPEVDTKEQMVINDDAAPSTEEEQLTNNNILSTMSPNEDLSFTTLQNLMLVETTENIEQNLIPVNEIKTKTEISEDQVAVNTDVDISTENSVHWIPLDVTTQTAEESITNEEIIVEPTSEQLIEETSLPNEEAITDYATTENLQR